MSQEDIVARLRRVVPRRGDIGLQQEAADEIERLRAVLQSLTHDPPASLAREPDTDAEVIIKMRAIARAALEQKP